MCHTWSKVQIPVFSRRGSDGRSDKTLHKVYKHGSLTAALPIVCNRGQKIVHLAFAFQTRVYSAPAGRAILLRLKTHAIQAQLRALASLNLNNLYRLGLF